MNFSFNSNSLNPKVRRNKFGVGSLVTFLIVGIIFAVAGYLMMGSAKVDAGWKTVTGKVVTVSTNAATTNGSVTYSSVVEYTVDNQKYLVTDSSSSSTSPTTGSAKDVAYDPGQPYQAKVVQGAGSSIITYLFILIGLAMIVAAPILFVKSRRRGEKINSLVQRGQKLQGVLVDIRSLTQSGNQPIYQIVASAIDPNGTVQNYVSDQLTGVGGLAMVDYRTTPIPIDVYIDPTNPQNYYVDISDVPNLTPERITQLIQNATQPTAPVATPAPHQPQQPFEPIHPVQTVAPTAQPQPPQPPQNTYPQ